VGREQFLKGLPMADGLELNVDTLGETLRKQASGFANSRTAFLMENAAAAC
jgi:hypothetical protein